MSPYNTFNAFYILISVVIIGLVLIDEVSTVGVLQKAEQN
jgi:hypothetical protein